MTVVRVTHCAGALNAEQRARLGEAMTCAVLEVETGKDAPERRPGVMVQFEPLPEGHWYHGGQPIETLHPGRSVYWISAVVMAGPWTDPRKASLAERLVAALREEVENEDPVWAVIHVVPDGAWSVDGSVVRIEQLLWAFEADRQETIGAFLGGSR